MAPGNGCEWLQIEAAGSQIYFAHDVGRPRIIDELTPSVWIKSDRPGPHLAVRVVLPRTIDPRSGRPVVTILMGAAYTDVGRWQQLQLGGIAALLTRQIHVLRVQLGPQVDGREAYLDAVLLNVSGGPGVTNVWIDKVEVAGYAATEGTARLVPVRLPPVRQPMLESNPAPRRSVKLVGSVLLVDGRPMFPRAIQHCGEPLAVLKKLGFNTVWLQRLPAPELLEEADRLGLWLICPPPRTLAPIAAIGPAFDSVLAWDLAPT